jgi:hypothetical protein
MNIPRRPELLAREERHVPPRPTQPDAVRVARNSPGPPATLTPAAWTVSLLASLALAALPTLTPEGTGRPWGSPVAEIRSYFTGVGSAATMLQLFGNLALLAAPAALVVMRRPAWGHFRLLTAVFLSAGICIECLQWALPLGRVVSPLDAALNATGAVACGLVAAHLQRRSAAVPDHFVGRVAAGQTRG